MYQLKAKDSEKKIILRLGNILNNFIIDNMKKTGFKGYRHLFIDCNIIDTNHFFGIFIDI